MQLSQEEEDLNVGGVGRNLSVLLNNVKPSEAFASDISMNNSIDQESPPKNSSNQINQQQPCSSSSASLAHSLIRGVLTQSCSTGAKNFTKCVFYHVKFSGVIQNIAYHHAMKTNF